MTQNKTKARVTKMAAVQKIGIFNILQKTGMYCSIATKTKTTPTQGHNHKSKNQTKELKNGRQNKQQTTTPPPTKQTTYKVHSCGTVFAKRSHLVVFANRKYARWMKDVNLDFKCDIFPRI